MRLGQKNSSVNDYSLAVYHLHRPDLYFVVCLFFPSAIIMGLMGFFTYKIKTQKDGVLFFSGLQLRDLRCQQEFVISVQITDVHVQAVHEVPAAVHAPPLAP